MRSIVVKSIVSHSRGASAVKKEKGLLTIERSVRLKIKEKHAAVKRSHCRRIETISNGEGVDHLRGQRTCSKESIVLSEASFLHQGAWGPFKVPSTTETTIR